jgi:lactate dehydrogenase-like 2-hydroxyacid dehydrogenase
MGRKGVGEVNGRRRKFALDAWSGGGESLGPDRAHAPKTKNSWRLQMAGEKADVLMLGPKPAVEEGLAKSPHVNLLKAWEAPDREGFLAAVEHNVRGIASLGGHAAIDSAFMKRFPRLEIVSSFGVGYDHVDAKWAGENNIVVTNTPDVLNEEVADTALGLLLSTVRHLPQAERYLRSGQWTKAHYPLTPSLRNRTVGIVGLGRIGKAIARRLDAMLVPVVYHSRSPQADVAYKYYPNLVDMARDVDVLLVITPGGAATRNLINAEVLKALGPNGILINMARGSVVDEPALIKALQDKTILSAGLDVFVNEPEVPQELIDMEHVVLFPHLGSGSVHTRRAMDMLVVDNLVSWFSGKGPLTPVAETPYKGK